MTAPADIAAVRERVRARPLPRHVAIIMDGNGRWAEGRGLPRVEGHRAGALAVRVVTEEARRVGLPALTLYAFSMQNWQRPKEEVDALMLLLGDYLEAERETMLRNGIRFNVVGDVARLPEALQARIAGVMAATAHGQGMILTLALSYGGREELVHAARAAAARKGAALDAEDLEASLWTAGLPELDLMVRTSGEHRISNFLLWQAAYAEILFTEALWPDFGERELLAAIEDFQGRERRFGLTSAQLADRGRPA
ncbi:MAG TPA: polyprenyl diphosphate synthase [Anaeromyxobacteraceae bacterium]|nr:polyprenyl diphosphate synthase [Anaeromyxobacteraceae bacterium]